MSERPAFDDLEALARLLDARFRIPFTDVRFGLDGLMGLVPVVGDAATLLPALYIIGRAASGGARKRVIVLMLLNSGIDALFGAIPLVGDLFDLMNRSNERNIRMLQRELARRNPSAADQNWKSP
ncbi:MAG: DUF4112 domain-containing protein [Pseudomonadota bacterium]